MYASDQTFIQDVKKEILNELRQENYPYMPPLNHHERGARHGMAGPMATEQMHETIKDSVKQEVLAEVERQQTLQAAQIYGVEDSLSDRRLQQMINDRYRTIDQMRAELKKELMAIRKLESRRSGDPYVRELANLLLEEGQKKGLSLEQLISGLERGPAMGSGVAHRMSGLLNSGQRKGFLYGLGTAVACYLLWPAARNNMRAIALRSIEEGMSVVDQAKHFFNGQQTEDMPPDFTNLSPTPAPPEN